MKKNRVSVKIDGRDYVLSGVESEEYILRIASIVNKKMSELKRTGLSFDTSMLAVLTALNIADDMEKKLEELAAFQRQMHVMAEENARLRKKLSQMEQKTPPQISIRDINKKNFDTR
ncbi:MAG: cell division protein ZapA [Christensenellales bacterium]|jgi:cell division protein ZapA